MVKSLVVFVCISLLVGVICAANIIPLEPKGTGDYSNMYPVTKAANLVVPVGICNLACTNVYRQGETDNGRICSNRWNK